MRDIIDDVDRWLDHDAPMAMATVVETWGSSPRSAGAKMAVTASGQVSGSVSGGCVEGAVVEACLEVMKGEPPKLLKYGVSDESAWDVGLACGGTIEIFVELVHPDRQRMIHDLAKANKSFAIATVIRGPAQWIGDTVVVQKEGTPIGYSNVDIESDLESAAQSSLISGKSQRQELLFDKMDSAAVEAFVEVVEPANWKKALNSAHWDSEDISNLNFREIYPYSVWMNQQLSFLQRWVLLNLDMLTKLLQNQQQLHLESWYQYESL